MWRFAHGSSEIHGPIHDAEQSGETLPEQAVHIIGDGPRNANDPDSTLGSQLRQHARTFSKLRLKIDLAFTGDHPIDLGKRLSDLKQIENQLASRLQLRAQ